MKKFALCLLLGSFCVVGLTAASPAEKGVRIRLPLKATVVGPQVKLGEVAEILGTNKVLAEKLRRLVVVKAAPAGQKMRLSKSLVKIALRKEGYSLDGVFFEGEQAAEVLTKSQEFMPDSLLPELKQFVLGRIGEAPENVAVTMLGAGQRLLLPGGLIKASFRPSLSGRYEGTLLLTAEIEVDGRLVKIIPLRAQVEVSRKALVTTRKVDKGEKFDEGNVTVARVSASKLPPGALQGLPNVLGRTAAVFLSEGTILRVQSLYDPPVIKRGQTVRALVRRGSIEITVEVRAVEDGKAGETIRVENTESHKVLRGRILDERTVQLVEGK